MFPSAASSLAREEVGDGGPADGVLTGMAECSEPLHEFAFPFIATPQSAGEVQDIMIELRNFYGRSQSSIAAADSTAATSEQGLPAVAAPTRQPDEAAPQPARRIQSAPQRRMSAASGDKAAAAPRPSQDARGTVAAPPSAAAPRAAAARARRRRANEPLPIGWNPKVKM